MKLEKKLKKDKKNWGNLAIAWPCSWDHDNPIKKTKWSTILNQPNVEGLNWKKNE
jgi:hypothetical protein